MDKSKRVLGTLIAALTLFFFVISMLILSFIFLLHGDPVAGIIGLFITYHIHFMIILGLLGIGIGLLSYYGFTSQQQVVMKSQEYSREILYKFLDDTEKVIIQYLLEHKMQPVTQTSISKLDNIGKVKAFRTLQRLEGKGLITLQKFGKTNRVFVSADLQRLLGGSDPAASSLSS